jgi:hypothetical protein
MVSKIALNYRANLDTRPRRGGMAVEREPVSTTHDPDRGGRPRLIVAHRPTAAGPAPSEFMLTRATTLIGSDARCDIRLDGLDPEHALVHHDDRDEYVLERRGRFAQTLVNGERVDHALLRTATRLELSGWTLTFYREEYADHGRPYGGRIGGEAGHQPAQPPQEGASDHWTDTPEDAR